MKIFYEKEAGTALFQWKYQTPGHMDDMIMCSDGEYLTGLWFEGSEDGVSGDRAMAGSVFFRKGSTESSADPDP